MKLLAPAKVNLYLRVVGKRNDGYHFIDSLLVPVSLYDEIEFARCQGSGPRLQVSTDDPRLPTGKSNLVHRAATLILQHGCVRDRIHIHLRKKIPVGAGLGGGSSDAAATLAGLNRFLKLGCSRGTLLQHGCEPGRGCAFLCGRSSRSGAGSWGEARAAALFSGGVDGGSLPGLSGIDSLGVPEPPIQVDKNPEAY